MVVFTVAEDIEAKIRRLRELGKVSAEPESPSAPSHAPSPRAKPPKRPRRIGSIRERERKKRIIIGASLIVLILLGVAYGVYVWQSNKSKEALRNAKVQKIQELNALFKGPILNTSYGKAEYQKLWNEIQAARSINEVNSVDVKAAYNQVYQKYQQELAEKEREKQLKLLNEAKSQKKSEIELAFQSLLAQPLPEDIRKHVLQVENTLFETVDNATITDQVNAVDPTPYLVSLWREYYKYKIDSIPGNYVVLEYNGEKGIYTKDNAIALIYRMSNYTEIMKYRVEKVEFVKVALLLTRDRVVGGFIQPNSEIIIYAQNSKQGGYIKMAEFGYIDKILLPAEAGIINLNEQQGSSSSSSSSSSSQDSQNYQNSASAGGTTVSNSGASSTSQSSSSSTSQSSSASYSYSVNLGEIMKAISSGKIAGSEEALKQLQNYGDNLLSLESSLQLENIPNNVPFLVIVKVPSVYVPDILSHINTVYIGEVVGSS